MQPFSVRPQDLPTKAELARLRVEYVKDSRLSYLGHLDLIATVERCVRRSQLPFSIGNGFARRMRLQFSGALPVGASSSCEFFDLRLTEKVDEAEALDALRAATPRALAPVRASYVPGTLPALEAWLNRATWAVELLGEGISAGALVEAIELVRSDGELTYMRGEKLKTVSLDRCLVSCSVEGSDDGGVSACLDTRSGSGSFLRPGILLDAAFERAGIERPSAMRVRRTRQFHEEDGRLVEPFGPFAEKPPTPVS